MSDTKNILTRTVSNEWKRDVILLLAVFYTTSVGLYATGWTTLGAAVWSPLGGVAAYVAVELWRSGGGNQL